jgi:hypothetical protein
MASEPDNPRAVQRQNAGQSASGSAKAAEKQRLGAALRENLRRRKAQRQGRSEKNPNRPADIAD